MGVSVCVLKLASRKVGDEDSRDPTTHRSRANKHHAREALAAGIIPFPACAMRDSPLQTLMQTLFTLLLSRLFLSFVLLRVSPGSTNEKWIDCIHG